MVKIIKFLIALFLALGVLSGCKLLDDGSSLGYYDTYCVNPYNHYRVDYYQCNTHPNWIYYAHSGSYVPAVGGLVTGYAVSHYKKPSNAAIKTNGIPTSGGKAPKITSGPGVYKPKVNMKKGSNYKPKSVYKPTYRKR